MPCGRGLKPPKSPAEDLSNAKRRRTFAPSLRLINFVLHMYKQLTSEQRYTISVLLQKKCSLSFIARTIGVCVSTVSWEKRRNSNVQGVYDGRLAALKARRRKARSSASSTRTPIPNRVSIDDRPAHANGQTVGDWEMDTIVGKDGKGAVVTLVERKSCFMLMEKLDSGKRAVPLAHAVVRLLKGSGLPVRTITTDNRTEFAAHEIIARELGTTVYFAHPYCSWEKGAIENMNGLVRQYIPKRTNFREISRGYVRKIVEKLNNRPRKKNGFSKLTDMINNKIT